MTETIKFQFAFVSEFWDLPPSVEIYIDQDLVYQGLVDNKKQTIEFSKTLELGCPHTISLHRGNKLPGQCVLLSDGSRKDQYLIIEQVKIDNIDIQNLIWHSCWYEPAYPKQWQDEQLAKGHSLESKITGETWLGHNGVWKFEFTSPFYQFVIDQFR